ncbi:conserved hypothetical protein [Flavobacterium psychrophilum]|uniref:restriction endonuclease subunit S n=1 Tax=Flavobacterium psychrophilum TaxID=96345 RepID=UPI000B7C4043|nr:restriction endonuclease subunit S [Flavobacterium psychrophilum]ELM3649139.1 restriction endonuclease [Flavobacterium psychrophilum]ELM3724698.1 restriction endonuclease [Flavobacterium psychrophilum]SNB96052.1 conserved hypothetical protein [Flavobacterium psychrophilum]
MEWGEEIYLSELFKIKRGKRLTVSNRIKGERPLITAGKENTGVAEFIGNENQEIFPEDTITIDMFANVFYRNYCYSADDNILILFDKIKIKSKTKLFIVNSINKALSSTFSYGKQYRMNNFLNTKIQLPTKKGKIDFEFMETFVAELSAQRVAELSAHLKVTGLNNYILTNEEQKVLEDFENGKIVFKEFTFTTIFNKILQGRRLKKEDQIIGNIPFVMAGTTNTGIAKYISNPVASFPKNSITIDIFGNTFYRNYDFGAGDDTGVYWHDERNYSEKTMLYLTSSMSKLVQGKFDFGNKLRSSQSLDFKVQLPAINNKPNYKLIETFITAIQKLVIKEVVLYADRKTEATKLATQN